MSSKRTNKRNESQFSLRCRQQQHRSGMMVKREGAKKVFHFSTWNSLNRTVGKSEMTGEEVKTQQQPIMEFNVTQHSFSDWWKGKFDILTALIAIHIHFNYGHRIHFLFDCGSWNVKLSTILSAHGECFESHADNLPNWIAEDGWNPFNWNLILARIISLQSISYPSLLHHLPLNLTTSFNFFTSFQYPQASNLPWWTCSHSIAPDRSYISSINKLIQIETNIIESDSLMWKREELRSDDWNCSMPFGSLFSA